MYKVKKETELRERVRQVKEMFRLSMDGATAARLRHLNYRLVFGITYPRLKELAAQIEPDNELAIALWNLKQRESMIIATMIMEEIRNEEIENFVKDISNEEIAEYLCRNLLVRSNNPWEVVKRDYDNPFSDYVHYSLASALILSGQDDATIVDNLITTSPTIITKMENRMLSSVASLLKRAYKEHKETIDSILPTLSESEDLKQRWVAEEVKAYIIYS